jgi:peroxiredoxin
VKALRDTLGNPALWESRPQDISFLIDSLPRRGWMPPERVFANSHSPWLRFSGKRPKRLARRNGCSSKWLRPVCRQALECDSRAWAPPLTANASISLDPASPRWCNHLVFRSNQPDLALLSAYPSQSSQTLAALVADGPVFLIFLRHFGCTFCREAVAEIAQKRSAIEAHGAPLAFVHLGTEEKAKWFFTPYGLLDVQRFSDPQGRLYQEFGLERAELRQYLNVESITRMFGAWLHGHFVGYPAGDVQRMPGAFLMQRGEIRKAFRHKLVSDRPDYLALAAPI